MNRTPRPGVGGIDVDRFVRQPAPSLWGASGSSAAVAGSGGCAAAARASAHRRPPASPAAGNRSAQRLTGRARAARPSAVASRSVPKQLDGIGDRRRLVDDDRHLAPEVEAERRQRQAADHHGLVVDRASFCRAISARPPACRKARRSTLQRAARSGARPARDPTAWRRSAGCSSRAGDERVNWRRARSGPTISRSASGPQASAADPGPRSTAAGGPPRPRGRG